jgi:hypothetical protein
MTIKSKNVFIQQKKREEQFAKEKQILETKVEDLETELMSKLDETEQLRQRISDAGYKSLPTVNPSAVQPTTYLAPEPSTSYPLVMEDVYTDEEYARNRENVRKTLELIDAALNYSNG